MVGTKTITASNGFFTTQLGDTTPLDPALFDEYAVWIGVTLDGDDEMVPRHRISHAPYAMTASTLNGIGATRFLRNDVAGSLSVTNAVLPSLNVTQGTDRPGLVVTSQADSNGESAIRGVAQAASATILNSGAAILGTSQNQRGVMGISDNQQGVIGYSTNAPGVSGQSVNGHGIYAYSQNGHAIHAVGSVAANKVVYNTPRAGYFSIPGDVFVPHRMDGTVAYASGLGLGGAYFTAGTVSTMQAPVHLPHGATVTKVTAVVADSSPAYNLRVRLTRYSDAIYSDLAFMQTSTSSGNVTLQDTTIIGPVIDNINQAYIAFVDCDTPDNAWSSVGSALSIKRLVVEYTLSEAP